MNIRVEMPNLREIERRLGDLKPEASKIIARAINRAAQSAVTQMKKMTSKEYIIKQKNVAEAIKKPQKADKNNLKTVVIATGKKLLLSNFKINPKKPWNISPSTTNSRRSRKLKPPQSYKGQVRKGHSLKNILKTFVINTKIGPQLVSRKENTSRKRKKKFNLIFGPAVSDMLGNRRNFQILQQDTQSVLQRRIEHEVNRLLQEHAE